MKRKSILYVRAGGRSAAIHSADDMRRWEETAKELEKERAKDEIRDILRRMIAAEMIRVKRYV